MQQSTVVRTMIGVMALLLMIHAARPLLGVPHETGACCSSSGECGDGLLCFESNPPCSLEAPGVCGYRDEAFRVVADHLTKVYDRASVVQ